MFLRTFASLALVVGLISSAPASPGSGAVKGTSSTVFRVEYRTPGASTWVSKGSFAAEAAARSEATRLFNAGHDVRLTRAETVTWLRTQSSDPDIRRTPPTAPAGDLSGGISVVSLARAQEVFRSVASRSDIAFRYPADGCYARAHLMCVQMISMGLKPGKAWAFDDEAFKGKAPRLVALTRAHPDGFVAWRYHVAPALKVRKQDGTIVTAVLDPSLHDKPVSLATWQKRMTQPRLAFTPRMDVTRLGEAPRGADGRRLPGTGYGPGGNPPGDLTKAAREVMAMYKPHQGTSWTPPRPTVTRRSVEVELADLRALPARAFADRHLLDLE
jgi:hypothetical protein